MEASFDDKDVSMSHSGPPQPAAPFAVKIPAAGEATKRHPVQLLNEMHRGITFQLMEEKGAPPNTVFVMGVEVNGSVYRGEGKNKKEAKKRCALGVLKQVYQIEYPEEEQQMVANVIPVVGVPEVVPAPIVPTA